MSSRTRIGIVGGGPGGLCAAMLLASRGFDVALFERRDSLGGRSGGLSVGPYRFDVGTTMLMMPFVLEEMFALAGRKLSNELTLLPLEPMYRLDFGDRALEAYSDPRRMKDELSRFARGAGEGFEHFLTHERQRLDHLHPVLQRSWPDLRSMLTKDVAVAAPWIGIGRSLYANASHYFEDEQLRLAFSFQSAYLGMSPWECPGGFGIVPYIEHAWGIAHVKGGLSQVSEALARVARAHGAAIRTGTGVRRLLVDGERCTGLELDTGERFDFDEVIVNADAVQALETLLERDVSWRFNKRHLAHYEESCSTFMLYLGVDRGLPLAHHTFFFGDDYRGEMKRVFRTKKLPQELSLYVCNPSVTDPTLAPPGHSALYVLALMPNTTGKVDWEREQRPLRDRVIATLERRVGVPIERHVVAETSLTPPVWQADFNISHGAVFGPAHRIGQLLAFRPPNQLPSPSNVFLTGGGTSPGSGLPTIFESGRIAARLICERHQVPFPAPWPLPSVGPAPAAAPLGTAAAASSR